MSLSVYLSFAHPSRPLRLQGCNRVNRCVRRLRTRMPPTMTSSITQEYFGHTARFSYGTLFAEETPYVSEYPSDVQDLLCSATPTAPSSSNGGDVVVFSTGAVSRGPIELPKEGTFEISSLLPFADERLEVIMSYVEFRRGHATLRWDAIPGMGRRGAPPFADGPCLKAADIAGNWKALNVRWRPDGNSSSQTITREYSSEESTSEKLLRLPLGVSIVAPLSWTVGTPFSFGCGWSPNRSRRPVMIRSYGENGCIEKVDWRVEQRIE